MKASFDLRQKLKSRFGLTDEMSARMDKVTRLSAEFGPGFQAILVRLSFDTGISATGLIVYEGNVPVEIQTQLEAAGIIVIDGSVDIPMITELEATGVVVLDASGDIETATALQAAGVIVLDGAGSLTTTTQITATGEVVTPFPLDGLVSYWALEDDTNSTAVIDSHGDNDGTANKNTEDLSAVGRVGNCFDFDGSNDYFDGGQGILDAVSLGSWTFNFWIYRTSGDDDTFIGFIDDDFDGFIVIRNISADNILIENTSGDRLALNPTDTPEDEWTMVTVTYDYITGEAKSYLNAGLEDSDSWGEGETHDIDVTGERADIGRDGRGDRAYTTGKIDEVGIWNRALTPEEISALYNEGNGLAYPD